MNITVLLHSLCLSDHGVETATNHGVGSHTDYRAADYFLSPTIFVSFVTTKKASAGDLMNKIKAAVDTSDYEDNYNFLNFRIDGFWLDEKLEEVYRGDGYKGLVPTLLYSLESDEEKEVVWDRILPAAGEITICPILMCPDDCDFSCSIIVAEIENWGDSIKWNRLGIDKTLSKEAEKMGTKVDWFYKIGELEFSLEEYSEMILEFRKEFETEKKKWEENS